MGPNTAQLGPIGANGEGVGESGDGESFRVPLPWWRVWAMTTTTARTTNTMRYGIDVVVAGRIYLLFCCRNTLFGIDFTRHLREKMPSKREDETPP